MTDDIRLGLSFPSVKLPDPTVNLSPVQDWVLGVEHCEIALSGQLRQQADGKHLLFSAEDGKVFENAHVVAWTLVPA